MNRKEHLNIDILVFGKEFNNVHSWLDGEYWKYTKNPYLHWLNRHHIKAIYEKYGHFTPEYNSAYLHILFDFLSHFQLAYVPIDEEDVKSMLKSLQII